MKASSVVSFHSFGAFIAGSAAALMLAVFFLIMPLTETAKDSLLHLGTLEETLKFGAAGIFMLAFGGGMILPIAVAAGFGITEALIRLAFAGVISPLPIIIHIVAGVLMAFFFARIFKEEDLSAKALYGLAALILPIGFHLLYNIQLVPIVASL